MGSGKSCATAAAARHKMIIAGILPVTGAIYAMFSVRWQANCV
jgi:hypothetical protein